MGLLNKKIDDRDQPQEGSGLLTNFHVVSDPIDATLKSENEIAGEVRVEHQGSTGVEHKGGVNMHHSGSTGFELKGTTHLHHQGTAGVDLKGTAHVHHQGSTGVDLKGGAHVHHGGAAGLELGGNAGVKLDGGAEIRLGTGAQPLRAALELALGGQPLRLGPLSIDLGKLELVPDLELTVRLFGKYTLLSVGLRGRARLGRDDA